MLPELCTKRDDCQADPRIPKWMIVVAVLMLIERFIGSVNTVKDRRFIRENPKPVFEEDGDNHVLIDWAQRRKHNKSSVFAVLGAFVRLVQFITFILGCVYVFGIYSISDQCNPLVFWTSYIYCLLSIIFYIIGACVLGCVCCCVALMNDSFAQ
ncbi:hypothetical protein CRE_29748 [Caenorhabditis remanei]|uniref:Uncharacterized protein n=1 Tax=Caenorhabditis remanei TaxID=31234 RepID=E3LVK1_CAERE|nr:hypothetical protein CRE_29748 [Caenorhabditis remanei]